jgi:signal transduction histidine kinase
MLKRTLLIALSIVVQLTGFTQTLPDSSYTDVSALRDSVMLTKKAFIFFDSTNIATLENISTQHFVPLSKYAYRKVVPPKLVSKFAYLQIGLINTGTTTDTISFCPGVLFDQIIAYERKEDNVLKYAADGSKNGFCNFVLPPGAKKDYIIKLDFCRHDYNLIKPQLIKIQFLKTFKAVDRGRGEELRNVSFLLSGILFMMVVFTLVNYILTPKKEFLYYFGYTVVTFLLVFLYALLRERWGSFASFFNGYLDLFLLIAGNIFYLAFSRYFLNTKSKYKLLDQTFRAGELFLLCLLLAFTLVHFFTDFYLIERFLETFMKFIALGIGILFIIIAFKQKQPLMNYLAAGSSFSIFFSIISLGILLLKIKATGIFYSALFYHEIGLVFALTFFLLGLTHKNRRELIERTQEQEALKLDVEKKDFERQIAIIKAQQEERNRISADMHDDLGAGMTTIRLYSELAKNKIKDQSIPEIEKISSSANELLNKMNAIIWSMSSSNDSLGNMVAYIRSYSLEYFEDTGIDCHIIIPENLPNIVVSGEIRRNVFLVVKEALNNVLKHSKATAVNITLERVPDGLKLFIHDNGAGIDFEKLRQFGNGLKNMKKRMEDININFSIENNNGTLITLHRVVNDFNFSS